MLDLTDTCFFEVLVSSEFNAVANPPPAFPIFLGFEQSYHATILMNADQFSN
jgi:hypothetical protein